MLRILERNVNAIESRLVLLAPAGEPVPKFFRDVQTDPGLHEQRLHEVQRLRGRVYVADGAVEQRHLVDGRHLTPEDRRAWHLVMLDRESRVSSCVWFLEHRRPTSVDELRVRHCPLNNAPTTHRLLHGAVRSEMARARAQDLMFTELGGWAVSESSRGTCEGLILALSFYSLGRGLGGALGLTTATVRHASSTILRRLGATHLESEGQALPSYYDEKYQCEMELLRFDSQHPNPKYCALIDRLKENISGAAVLATPAASARETRETQRPSYAA